MNFIKTFAVLGLCALAASSVQADMYSYKAIAYTNTPASSTNGPFFQNASTNLLVTATASANLVINSDPIPIKFGAGFALLPQMQGTNTATGSTTYVTNRFDLGTLVNGSGGITNWTTTHPLKTITAFSGTNPVSDILVVDKTTANNVAYIRWYDTTVSPVVGGGSNNVTIWPVLHSYSLYGP